MIRYIFLLVLLASSAMAWAQSGGVVEGRLFDENLGEGVGFAVLVLKQDGSIVASAQTDMDGFYRITDVRAGRYELVVEAQPGAYPELSITGITVNSGKITKVDPKYEKGVNLDDFVVVQEYKRPIIEVDNTTGGQTLTSEQIERLATRDLGAVTATTRGVNQKDEGEALNSAGSRSTSNDVYIDGVRQIGRLGVTELDAEEVQVITTGVPAEFGDATGAITNITTKSPTRFSVAVQGETSQFLDAFAANRLDFSIAMPVLTKPILLPNGDTAKGGDGKPKKITQLGVRISGSYGTSLDERPSALGSFMLRDETLRRIQENPLSLNATGGRVFTSDFLTREDLVATKVRPNARESYGILNFKGDYKPKEDFTFTLGLQGQFNWGASAGTLNRLFNFEFNPEYRTSTFRTFGRFTHKVMSTVAKASADDANTSPKVFQNLVYEIQADYTRTDGSSYDPRYRDRIFEYGYVGQIFRGLRPNVGVRDTQFIVNSGGDTIGIRPVFGHSGNFISFQGYNPATDINPGLAAYNNLIDFGNITTMEEMEIVNGRFTGNRDRVYNLFNTVHAANNSFGKSNSTQIRANFTANFDLVTKVNKQPLIHAIKVGAVYEQRVERFYSINPFSIWTLADQTVNDHLSTSTDPNRPTGEFFYDEFSQRFYERFDPLIRTDEEGRQVQMTTFGRRFRESQGLGERDWVNIHQYRPDQLDLAMFDPTLLIQGRNQIISYQGYDYLGNPLGTSVQFNDFFNEVDANGVKTRPIAPWKPIYIAGYIQDKFQYKDIIVRLGLRFDSYDANTKVLRDPYSIAGTFTAAEFENPNSPYTAARQPDFVRPSNIGDNFVVYVNDNSPDATVLGYRDGEQWYNAGGSPVNNPNELGTIILPALRGFSTAVNDPQGEQYDPDQAFRDYRPQVIAMPRVSFSFPLSEKANFYANYDILAQRPPTATAASPLTYFNFRENATGPNPFLPNPNLRSQRTVNYEVGFQQAITDHSKFKLSALYREERDLIQIRQYILAYPITYQSFGNDDFSTTKSFGVEYELRPSRTTKNKNISILANYNLQFAEGTGSNPTSSAGIAARDLKNVFPLDFDQRHSIFLNFDFRYKEGKEYNGPRVGGKKEGKKSVPIFENTGFNLSTFASSGTPYTRKAVPGGIGTNQIDRVTEGSINGARVPWNYRFEARLDRTFTIYPKKTDAEGNVTRNMDARPYNVNVYIRVQNILNTQNVLNVYAATGSPTEDGFLTMENSPGLQLLTSFPDVYPLLYELRMINPFNISRPRRIFLGASFQF